ncbi:hypothetical protein YC2023_103042 [Brassica napus]
MNSLGKSIIKDSITATCHSEVQRSLAEDKNAISKMIDRFIPRRLNYKSSRNSQRSDTIRSNAKLARFS